MLLALIISFSLILVLINKKVPMGISVVSGGVILSLLSGLSGKETLRIVGEGLLDPNTIQLVLAVIMISILSNMMQVYGVMERMVEALEGIVSSTKALIFIIPSLLSTFTASGSAIVAAPIINHLGDKVGLSPARKAAINIYIRHVWYFILPIAVHLINASFIGEIPISSLILAQMPLAIISFITAYLVYLAPVKNKLPEGKLKTNQGKVSRYWAALCYTAPVLISIILVFFMPFYLALVVSCILTYLLKTKEAPLKDVIIKGLNPPIIYAAAGVMIFKNIINNIPQLSELFTKALTLGIPLELLAVFLSLFLAYAAANVSVVISMLYPLVLPLVPAENKIALAVLIYVSAYSAYMISPVHMCQALTVEFFGLELKELYREYRITIPVLFLAGVLTYGVMVYIL